MRHQQRQPNRNRDGSHVQRGRRNAKERTDTKRTNRTSKKTNRQQQSRDGRMVATNRRVGRWFLGETLGKGGYSWVKKGYDRKDGRVVALKFTSKAKENFSSAQSKQIQNEIESLRKIKDKHVVQLLAYNLNAKYPSKDGLIIPSVLFVLEYLPGGELFDILYYTSALTEKIAKTYFKQLMSGMEACHSAGICHRDIKPQNLLLDANFQLKIADFGLAKVFEKDCDKIMNTFYVGTKGYQSPFILKHCAYTTACDVFSCGVVLFILLAGYPPFEAASPKCRWYNPLTNGNARQFWKQHRGCGICGSAKDLITRMIWYDDNKRITIESIKKHKWYNGESLNGRELASELNKLHRLMEIKRRRDSEKQKQLQDSIKRDLTRFIKIWNETKKVSDSEREIQCEMGNKREEYWNGDVVTNVVDVYEASLRIYDSVDKTDILSIFDCLKCFNKEKGMITVNKTVRQICDLAQVSFRNDLYLEIWFSDDFEPCIAPPLPPNESVTLKDIYTTFKPRYVLQYISKRVIDLGGNTNIDLNSASLSAHLATHNFPAPVQIQIRIFCDPKKECYLVKFERISGDTLHFGRVLKQLISKCGHCLTGVPKEQFEYTEKERKEAEQLFGDK